MKAAPAVVVVKSYDEPLVAFEGKFEDPEITTFVELSTSPKLVEMDQYVHTSCPMHICKLHFRLLIVRPIFHMAQWAQAGLVCDFMMAYLVACQKKCFLGRRSPPCLSSSYS